MKQSSIGSLKRGARILLQNRYGFLAGITILMSICQLFLSWLSGMAVPTGTTVFSLILELGALLVVNMVYTILRAGLIRLYLNIASAMPYSYEDLISAFRSHPEPVAAYSCISTGVVYGSVTIAVFLLTSGVSLSVTAAVCCLLLVLNLWFDLTYSPVLFLHAQNPNRTFPELMHASSDLMKGHRMKYLLIRLSFIGVILLGVLSFGIGMLFVQPYMTMTDVLYFMELQNAPFRSEEESGFDHSYDYHA